MSISTPVSPAINAHIPTQSSPLQQMPLDDQHTHIQEFEWLRVVESVLADREYSELEITQKELEELIPTLDNLDLSTDEDEDFSFGNYIHFSPKREEYPGEREATRTPTTTRRPTRSQLRKQSPNKTPRSIPRTEWARKPGSITPLEIHPPLELKRDPNGGTPRKSSQQKIRLPTKIPVLSSRLGPPIVPVGSVDPVKSGLSAFRSNLNLKNGPLPKIQVFEDSETEPEVDGEGEEDEEDEEEDSCESLVNDSSVQFISESCVGEDSSVQFIKEVHCEKPPSVSPPSTPPSDTQSSPSQLGFAANVTQPLRRSRRLAEAELYNEPRSPGRVCSPIRREFNLKPSLRVSGNQASSSKLISSLHSALSGSEPLGFYSANDLRARLEGRESGRKRRTRKNQRSVKWAEELEW